MVKRYRKMESTLTLIYIGHVCTSLAEGSMTSYSSVRPLLCLSLPGHLLVGTVSFLKICKLGEVLYSKT